MSEPVAITITFLSVTAAWVVFRAESVGQAISIWKGMAGGNGFAIPSVAAGICQACTQATLITGMEFVQGGILLSICMIYVNAQKQAQHLEPNFKNLAYFTSLFFTSIWMSGSHESFIYWQF
jgi:hypothetical protein